MRTVRASTYPEAQRGSISQTGTRKFSNNIFVYPVAKLPTTGLRRRTQAIPTTRTTSISTTPTRTTTTRRIPTVLSVFAQDTCFLSLPMSLFFELYQSYLECTRHKVNTDSAMRFAYEKEKNLIALKQDIENRVYTPGISIYFIVTHPKVREVFAADFRDRIVHHMLIRSIEKVFYATVSPSVYSCLRERGTHRCIQDLRSVYRYYRYFLQIDIQSFFMSIDR